MNKNTQKGFIVPLIIGIVAVLIIASGVYFAFEKGKSAGVNQVNDQVSSINNQGNSQSSATSTTDQKDSSYSNVLKNCTNGKVEDTLDGWACDVSASEVASSMPVITSINPSSGPIGTIVELKGNNLAGFEGELSAWIENSNGEKAFLPGIGSVPRADQTIRVKVDNQLCKEDLSSKGGQCSSYMTVTPGTYKIYTYPWGNMSNTVQFIVTAPSTSSTAWQTYTNSQYGFSIQYPSDFTLSSTSGGDNPSLQFEVTYPSSYGSGTDLSNAFIDINVRQTDKNSCYTTDGVNTLVPGLEDGKPAVITINGIDYGTGRLGDSAMGSYGDYGYLNTYHNNLCYSINITAVGAKQSSLPSFNLDNQILPIFLQIAGTFKFTN